MSGNQGLSRQFISTILVRGSVELRKRLFVADVSRSGFHVSQSSLSSSRSVGMSLTQASSVTVSASSIHASRMRDVDLMLSMFRSRRSEEHTSELQSLMRTSYAVFCSKKKIQTQQA